MKLKDSVLLHERDGEQLLLCADASLFSGIVRINATTAQIVSLLRENTDADAITEAMCARYDAPRDVIARDSAQILEGLRSLGILEE